MPPRPSQDLPLLLVGVDHRSAEIELRERVAYSDHDAEDLLVRLISKSEIAEAMLLSTCNRTEIYLRPTDEDRAFEIALQMVFADKAPEIRDAGHFYVKHRDEAARHLLLVAAGLESMVLGEAEILGQVKHSASVAEGLGTSGVVLRRLARTAISAGKRARTETRIGEGPVSFGYAAVELASNIFSGLDDCSVLILGAGETGTAVTRCLLDRGAREIAVANRTRARAEIFQQEFSQARIVDFDDRLKAIDSVDLIIAATGSPEPILTLEGMTPLMKRRGRPLLIVDLGVPRDVDERAGNLPNLFLHDVDSLEELIGHTLQQRREQVPAVSRIVDAEFDRLEAWFVGLEAAPLVARLHRRAEKIRRGELESRKGGFPEETHAKLDELTRSIVRKLLHHPSTRLRSSESENLDHLAALRELFQLDDENDA